MKIVNYRNITYSEVYKMISKLRNERYELDQITVRVHEYVGKFSKCPKAEDLVKELVNTGLKEITAVMIANIVPKEPDEVRILLNFEGRSFDTKEIESILNKVKEFCAEEK